MKASALAVLVCATGCRAVFGLDDPDPPVVEPDAPVTPDAEPRLCWGTEPRICLPSDPAGAGPTTLPATIDTSTSPLCEPAIAGYCVIAAATITVATTDVTGGRPLVLIGADDLVVEGTLDAASHAAKAGPGADAASCNAFAAAPSAEGGGAGGSFAGSGGNGGGNNRGDTGGRAAPLPPRTGLRGGCPGQGGGRVATNGGAGGRGGGAAYLIAGRAIDVRAGARVNASGAAGAGSICTGNCGTSEGTGAGAGGAGSGGMLILEAPSIVVNGLLFADGGSGGQGATVSNNGISGVDPDGTKAAPGAGLDNSGNSNGGDGGNGSHGSTLGGGNATDGDNASADVGGGGGGGGAGVVRVYGTGAIGGGGTVSPLPEHL